MRKLINSSINRTIQINYISYSNKCSSKRNFWSGAVNSQNKPNFSFNSDFNFDNLNENKNIKLENFQPSKLTKFVVKPKFSDKIIEHYYSLDINASNTHSNRFLEILSSDINEMKSYNEKIFLNNIIENLVVRPEQMNKELHYLSENPAKFIEVLFNSEFVENLTKEQKQDKTNSNKSLSANIDEEINLNYKFFVYLLRYIKLIIFNFPILIKDTKLMSILTLSLTILMKKDTAVKILGGKVKDSEAVNYNNIKTLLNLGYEISLIVDKFNAESLKRKQAHKSKSTQGLLIENSSNDHEKENHSAAKKKDHYISESSYKAKKLAEECLFSIFNKDVINLCTKLINVEISDDLSKTRSRSGLKGENKEKNLSKEANEVSNNINNKNSDVISASISSNNIAKSNSNNKVFLENLDEIYLNNQDSESLINFSKLVYVLSKIQSSGLMKTDLQSFIYPANYDKLRRFANESNFSKSKISTEANIILCNQLKKLNLIQDKFFVRRIKYDGFDLEKFHIFFNTFLKGKFENDIDIINLQNNIFSHSNSDYFDEPLNVEKFMLMRNTIDWFIKSVGSSIFYHNQSMHIYAKQKNFIRKIMTTLASSLGNVNDPNALFLISYFFANFSANPKSAFEIIHKKIFDIEEINPQILKSFVDSVDHRMKYFLQYDHETHILTKLKKNHYEPYDKYLDNVIINITKQFLNKLSQNKVMPESLFEVGLKCLRILFELEVNDPNYKVDEYIISSMQIFKKKCFIKAAPYLKYIIQGENNEIVNTLTKIIPYVKYYDNKVLDEVYKKKNDVIYEEFITNLLIKEHSSVESLVILYNNISEYLIIEDSYKNVKENKNLNNSQVSKQFLLISNAILKKISPIIIKKSNVDYSDLLNSRLDQNLIPPLIINLYNLCLFDKEKNLVILDILENHITMIKGLRNLKGHELFKLKKEIMNENTIYQVLSNLQTILLIKNKENIFSKIITHENIRNFTKNIISTINKINLKLKMNLSPLSHLISSVIEVFDHNDISEVLEVFGNRNVENYHPLFIKALLVRFSNSEYLLNLIKKKEVEFFNFAINWPLFIKSAELVKVILNCHESKLLQIDRYEIINILAYNHYNHTKLLNFFGESLKKIKRKKKQKDILCEYVFNCTYVNYKVSLVIFESILDIYEELSTTIYVEPFINSELCDLVVLSILSNLHNSLSEKHKIIFNHIIDKIKENLSTNLRLKIKDEYIKYYPSIVSEDRFFNKSLTNAKNQNSDWEVESAKESGAFTGENAYSPIEEQERKSYLRQANDSNYSIDKDFEDFFSKKRDLMYGHQSYIIDDVLYRQILKKWCMAKIFRLDVENETIINQLTYVLVKQQEQNKKSEVYEKLYLKMISFAFHNHHNLFSGYKHPESGLVADYYIKSKDGSKEMFVIYIPKNFTSYEFPENRMIPDGVYEIFITCFRELSKGEIFYVFEDEMGNYTDKDIEKNILDRISKFMEDDNNNNNNNNNNNKNNKGKF